MTPASTWTAEGNSDSSFTTGSTPPTPNPGRRQFAVLTSRKARERFRQQLLRQYGQEADE